MKRSHSSIIDEIKNNSVKGKYDPEKANHKAYVKRHKASFRSRKIIMNRPLRKVINLAQSYKPPILN